MLGSSWNGRNEDDVSNPAVETTTANLGNDYSECSHQRYEMISLKDPPPGDESRDRDVKLESTDDPSPYHAYEMPNLNGESSRAEKPDVADSNFLYSSPYDTGMTGGLSNGNAQNMDSSLIYSYTNEAFNPAEGYNIANEDLSITTSTLEDPSALYAVSTKHRKADGIAGANAQRAAPTETARQPETDTQSDFSALYAVPDKKRSGGDENDGDGTLSFNHNLCYEDIDLTYADPDERRVGEDDDNETVMIENELYGTT